MSAKPGQAHYSVTKLSRPPAQPRFGSLIERLFRTSETEFVHTLRGNTQIMQKVRLVTKAVNPKELATWTLEQLYYCFCAWAYEVYDLMTHSTLGQSPREAFVAGLDALGVRANRKVADDESFRILMLPTTRSGKAKVQKGRGVKVNHLYYWCNAFRLPGVEGTSVPVRFDPFNAGLAYAFVEDCWQHCTSQKYTTFVGKSAREIALASAELRQQKRQSGQQIDINANLLATFLASVEGQEALLLQQLKDRAAQQVRASIFQLAQPETNQVGVPAVEASAPLPEAPTRRRKFRVEELEVYGGSNL